MSASKPKHTNKPSLLLDNDENYLVYSLIGSRCITMATTVAQLYFSEIDWTFQATGVLCFVRDTTFRSYFLRFYDLDMRRLKFEQEVYLGMQYNTKCSFFHQVEADDKVVGFNFVDNATGLSEASELAITLKSKVGKMTDGTATKVAKQDFVRPPTVPTAQQHVNMPQKTALSSTKPQSDGHTSKDKILNKLGKDKGHEKDKDKGKDKDKEKKEKEKKEKKEKEKKDKEKKEKEKKDKGKKDKDKDKHKGKLRREDISTPIDFQHVQHVGSDSAGGGPAMRQVDLKDDPALKFLFGKFGENFDAAMQSKSGQKRVDEFIKSKGGIEKVHEMAAQSGYVSFEQPEPPTPQSKPPLHRPPPTPPSRTPQPRSPQQRSPATPQLRTPQTPTSPAWTPQPSTPQQWPSPPSPLTTPESRTPPPRFQQRRSPPTPLPPTPPAWSPQPESPQQWPSPPSSMTTPESRTPPPGPQKHRPPPPPPPPRRQH